MVPGGGISFEEGGGPLPSIIADRCGVTTVWFGAPGELVVEASGDAVASTTTSVVEPTCSGYAGPAADPVLIEQPELPEEVAVKRAAIWDAAIECDWEQLGRQLGEGFLYSFGGGDDPIGYWQELEDAGEDPLFYLVELLNRPFAEAVEGSSSIVQYYAWPSAYPSTWSEVPETDREALRPLYDDADFAAFDDLGGYFGYRIGITPDGTWVFFLSGD